MLTVPPEYYISKYVPSRIIFVLCLLIQVKKRVFFYKVLKDIK